MADKLKQIMYIRVVLSTAAAGKSFGRNVCVFVRARAMLYRSGIQAREDEEVSVHEIAWKNQSFPPPPLKSK